MSVTPVLVVVPPLLVAAIIVSAVRRSYRTSTQRAQVALEQALDHLEFGSGKPVTAGAQLLDALTSAARLPR
jgi:Flp pilus assembly protein TadB